MNTVDPTDTDQNRDNCKTNGDLRWISLKIVVENMENLQADPSVEYRLDKSALQALIICIINSIYPKIRPPISKSKQQQLVTFKTHIFSMFDFLFL